MDNVCVHEHDMVWYCVDTATPVGPINCFSKVEKVWRVVRNRPPTLTPSSQRGANLTSPLTPLYATFHLQTPFEHRPFLSHLFRKIIPLKPREYMHIFSSEITSRRRPAGHPLESSQRSEERFEHNSWSRVGKSRDTVTRLSSALSSV